MTDPRSECSQANCIEAKKKKKERKNKGCSKILSAQDVFLSRLKQTDKK